MPAYNFKIKGQFNEVDRKLVEITDHASNIVAFLLPDGRTVQLVMALEVLSPEGDKISYVTNESEMVELGFNLLDYESLNFYPTNEE